MLGTQRQVCSSSTTAASGSLSCNITDAVNTSVFYRLVVRYTGNVGTTDSLVASGWVYTGDQATLGIVGVVVMLMILLVMIPAGIWSPTASIIMSVVAIFAGMFMGFIYISYGAVLSLMVAGLLLIYKFNKR